jgi:hypothetical protein
MLHSLSHIDRTSSSITYVTHDMVPRSLDPTLHRYGIRIRRYRYGDTLIRHFQKTRIRRYGKYINIPKKIRILLLRIIFTLVEQSTNRDNKI